MAGLERKRERQRTSVSPSLVAVRFCLFCFLLLPLLFPLLRLAFAVNSFFAFSFGRNSFPFFHWCCGDGGGECHPSAFHRRRLVLRTRCCALRSGTNKNREVSTGLLARPFARSLAPLTRSLTRDCSLRLRPPLCSLVRSLAHFAHSLACGKVNF